MKIHLAEHYGLCFGVRDALATAHAAAENGPVTVLGEIVHNPIARRKLESAGARDGRLERPGSASTRDVIITAHGASNGMRKAWQQAGHRLIDTTCPLVRKAHDSLAALVAAGFFPVVIGQHDHVEVRGLIGDFPQALVILDEAEISKIPEHPRIGVISQTTQPPDHVADLVQRIRLRFPRATVRFVNTVCYPTRQRQEALEALCRSCDHVVVVGGRSSNNTASLATKAERMGARAIHVETADELEPDWFEHAENVGVTAGTSTLEETVQAVVERLKSFVILEVAR